MSATLSQSDYVVVLRRLESYARKLSRSYWRELSADAISDLGSDADFAALCSHVYSLSYRVHRSERRRAARESEYSRMRGDSIQPDSLDADAINPLDYLSLIDSDSDREIVRRWIFGESQADIGSALGIPQKTISNRIRYSIEAIRSELGL